MRPGLHVHPTLRGRQPYSPQDKQALWSFSERLQPSMMLFLDKLDWAREFKLQFPLCRVVFRPWSAGDGNLSRTIGAKDYYNQHIRECDGGIILNVGNEPDGYLRLNDPPDRLRQMSDWDAEVMDLFGQAGASVVIPNWGTGHPDTDRLDDFKTLWDAFDKWAAVHYLGVHEYWYRQGVFPGDGRIARYRSICAYYTQKRPGKLFPRFLVTEGGCDSKLDGSPQRGWKDSKTDEVYASEIVAVNRLYSERVGDQFPVLGWVIYCWGNSGVIGTGDDWTTYQVDNAPALQNETVRLLDLDKPPAPPPPPQVVAPAPGDYVLGGVDSMRVRSGAAINQVIVDVLKRGEVFRVLDGTLKAGSDLHWVQGETPRGKSGWLAFDYPGLTLTPVPPESPPETPSTPTGVWEQMTLPELNALLIGLKGLTRALEQTINERSAALNGVTMQTAFREN